MPEKSGDFNGTRTFSAKVKTASMAVFALAELNGRDLK